ncbi:hypothetical protein [uncultured Bilophila sp.]|uniref:hypothetical protein n=1 Tax=uncultured Bilophila sp. TaxID=529385 RepID=UPI0025D35FF8|nr:hypothetical protein [uncultured Bilophila sp.]
MEVYVVDEPIPDRIRPVEKQIGELRVTAEALQDYIRTVLYINDAVEDVDAAKLVYAASAFASISDLLRERLAKLDSLRGLMNGR